jgi:hypothetical protein
MASATEPALLRWPAQRVYSLSDARTILRTVHSAMHTFHRVSDEEYRVLAGEVPHLNRWLSHPVSVEQLLSLRNLLNIHLSQLSRSRFSRAPFREQLQQYFATYRSVRASPKEVVVRGAALYRVSPLAMCEQYFHSLKYTKDDVKRMFRSPNHAPAAARDAIQWAKEEDALGPHQTTFQSRGAAQYERLLERWLRARGVPFRTQADLEREQIALHGRALSTPDILFTAPVLVRRTPDSSTEPLSLRWLDAKNYLYAPLVGFEQLDCLDGRSCPPSFLDRRLLEQYERYTEHFGPGAFVFAGGFVDFRPGMTFLDLDLSETAETGEKLNTIGGKDG